jgi:hypothetical protein
LRTAGCAIRPAHSTSAGSAAASSASSSSAAMRRRRADPHDVGVDGHVVELGHPGDVDEDLGAGRARAELGDQRLATGEHPGPPPGERGDRLVDGGGALVAERRGLHLIACGLTGEPTEPVIVSGGATSWNS